MKKLFLLAIIWICFLIILVAQASTLHPQSIAVIHTKGYDTLGVTFCDSANKPKVMFGKQDSVELLNTKFHEEVHVIQMLSYPGGCRGFMKRYSSDKQFRFDTELEAYCYANALADVSYHDAVITISQTMWDLYDSHNLYSVVTIETELKCSEAYHAIPP